jgi:hypothetical protein
MAGVVRMVDGMGGSLVSTEGDKGEQSEWTRLRRLRHTIVMKRAKMLK